MSKPLPIMYRCFIALNFIKQRLSKRITSKLSVSKVNTYFPSPTLFIIQSHALFCCEHVTKGKGTLFGYFKGFRLPYDTPTMRVVTHLATGLYTMTSHDSPKEDNFLLVAPNWVKCEKLRKKRADYVKFNRFSGQIM